MSNRANCTPRHPEHREGSKRAGDPSPHFGMTWSATENLYNIDYWGEGYFAINKAGNIEVFKNRQTKGVELQAIVNAANRAGLQLPLLMRFPELLCDRVAKLYKAFQDSREELQYSGSYQLVYPIKVNQVQSVLCELLKDRSHPIGLEAGSKAELMAAMGMLGQRRSTIICNGYKDASYIRIALIASQMGHEVFIIIEKPSELNIILKESARLRIQPKLGLRLRLMNTCAGKWANSGGSKSKFGLNATQTLELLQVLKANNSLQRLQLIHCHLGSQIANLDEISLCMEEVARYYVTLRNLDAPINTIDVGGGLGIDYAGSHSNHECSMNYGLKEYASSVIQAIRHLCEKAGLPEPHIISESGRALTAHHAVLVTNIVDVEIITKNQPLPEVTKLHPPVIREILAIYQSIEICLPAEVYRDASLTLEEAQILFRQGVISLKEKATVEDIFTKICLSLQGRLNEEQEDVRELLRNINERLAAKIFCNLSFFQSLPDAWAIGQIFPIAPLTQLTEDLSMPSILEDLTCDSDGTIKQYTGCGSSGVSNTLLLPPYKPNKPYTLAFFLVGAYQEILGNLHNLFGDTNSVAVSLGSDGSFAINELESGDTVANVLHYVHFDSKALLRSYENQLINADLPADTREAHLNELRSIMYQQTYLDNKQTINKEHKEKHEDCQTDGLLHACGMAST